MPRPERVLKYCSDKSDYPNIWRNCPFRPPRPEDPLRSRSVPDPWPRHGRSSSAGCTQAVVGKVSTRDARIAGMQSISSSVSASPGDVRLDDLQDWWDQQQQRGSPASHRQAVAAVKSLLTFAQRSGAIRYNVGVAIEIKRAPDELAKRILSEDKVLLFLFGAARRKPRDYALVQLLYRSGLRVSELVGLRGKMRCRHAMVALC